MALPFSVLVLTLNEEPNLALCLEPLRDCDDIVILDSFSTDQTEQIAAEYRVRFHKRHFDDYASQRNYGINYLKYKHPWLLIVDADETVTQELSEEITKVLNNHISNIYLYRMRRKDHLMGKWIKRSSGYPTWFGRLVKIGSVRVERAINEEYVTDGEIGYLENHLHHFPFNKGFSAWLDKHNRYSTMEAELIVNGVKSAPRLKDFFHKDPAERRRAIKSIVYRFPGRPLLMFVALYFVKGGFLDGRAGFTFCLLRSFYEFLINCKVKEMRSRSQSLPL